MSEDEYVRVDSAEHTLLRYPCGAAAGDRLCLRRPLHLETPLGQPIGQIIGTGSIWKVLAGRPEEPDVVWFEDPRGELHTWDDASLWSDFRRVDDAEQAGPSDRR